MKHDANRVRRLNQQIDVWRKNAPDYIQVLENKLASQDSPTTSKDGSKIILSARNMSDEQYQQQENIMHYIEHELGTYTEQFKEIERRLAEQLDMDPEEITTEDIQRTINAIGSYNELIKELFNLYDSKQARYYFNNAETKYNNVEDKVEYLSKVIYGEEQDKDPFTYKKYMAQQKKDSPFE